MFKMENYISRDEIMQDSEPIPITTTFPGWLLGRLATLDGVPSEHVQLALETYLGTLGMVKQ